MYTCRLLCWSTKSYKNVLLLYYMKYFEIDHRQFVSQYYLIIIMCLDHRYTTVLHLNRVEVLYHPRNILYMTCFITECSVCRTVEQGPGCARELFTNCDWETAIEAYKGKRSFILKFHGICVVVNLFDFVLKTS
jgi:hypothetical protein